MKTSRAVLLSALLVAATTAAYGDETGPQHSRLVGSLQGQSRAVGPRQTEQRPTPLFTLGGLSFGIWAPVAAPYDATANRNLAANNPW